MSPPALADALIGELVDDRYQVRRLIGRGGMGAVYEAEAVRLGRLCAVKVLLAEYTGNQTAIQRFRREAQVAARIKHPHVVEIFDTGTTRTGQGYIAMELLRGESLDRTLRREGKLPWPRARHIALQICRALSAAHVHGIVHRDMKPENCFRLTQEGDPDFIKVLDFGIAKLSDADSKEYQRLTATDSIIGTWAYMAYEQIAGSADCDHRVDVWALGVVLYEMLTGVLPFKGQNQGQIWSAIFQHVPVPMRSLAPEAGIPAEAEAIVARALEKSRDSRYPTVDDLAKALLAVEGPITAGGAGVQIAAGTAPPAGWVDAKATTIASMVPATPTVHHAEPASFRESPGAQGEALHTATPVHGQTELARTRLYEGRELRGATQESGRPEGAPGTDPAGHAAIAPASERVGTAVSNRVEPAAAAVSVTPRKRAGTPPALFLGSGCLVGAAAIAIALSLRPSADPAPSPTRPPDGVPLPPAPQSAGPVRARHAAAAGEPRAPDVASLPDQPDPSLPALEDETSTPTAKTKGAKATPPLDLRTKVLRKLVQLCDSKAVRTCFIANQLPDKRIEVGFVVDARTGKARAEFSPTLRGAAITRCLEREIAAWQLPIGSATDPDTRQACVLNR